MGDVDVTIFNVVKYLNIIMSKGSPNMVDSLFVDDKHIVYIDEIGSILRNNRKELLSMRIWHSFRGMAFQHLKRLENRTREGRRKDYVDEFGYDVKDASHVVRLVLELEQYIFTGECDLTSNADQILSVRRGEWDVHEVRDFFEGRVAQMESDISRGKSVLPEFPNQEKIKGILVECVQEKHGIDLLSDFGWGSFKK